MEVEKSKSLRNEAENILASYHGDVILRYDANPCYEENIKRFQDALSEALKESKKIKLA